MNIAAKKNKKLDLLLHESLTLDRDNEQIRYLFEIWPGSRVVMQRTANPFTSVRFRPGPPNKVINF